MSMTFKHIPVGLIYKKDNIREELETELGDLQASIEQFDMLQPILVRPVGNKYEIVSGHRRYAAMKLYGELFIPCVIRDDITDDNRLYIQLVENTHRKQMAAWELVEVFNRLKKENPGLTNAGIAQRIGRPAAWVANQYGAAKMAEKMVGYLGEDAKKLTAGQIHARAKKAGFVGTRKASKDIEVYYSGNSVQIKAKSKEARDKVLELIEAEFPPRNVRRKA